MRVTVATALTDALARRRTSLTTDTGAPAVTYGYDDAGRLTSVQRAGVTHASASYAANGRLQQLDRANGLSTTYTRDNADRLTRLLTTGGGTTQTDFTVTLTRAGQVSGASETIGGASRDIACSYDLRRLTSATETPGTTYGYSYDLVGNRTGATVNGSSIGSWSYDTADQVVGWSYDGAGNRLSDGTQTSTFDPLGRLASVTQASITTSYGYTGDGHLALQTAGGVITRYTLDTVSPLVERLGATTGGASTWYVRGFGQELNREQGGANTWLVADRLGSIRAEFASGGTLTTSLNYDPYGVPQGTSQPSDYGFTGEPQSGALGLVHLRARWYSPGNGRFLSQDAFLGLAARPQSLHRFAYAENSPTAWRDPSGFCPSPPASFGPAICFALFIAPSTIDVAPMGVQVAKLHGDGRSFSATSPPEASRIYVWINVDTGHTELYANPTGYIDYHPTGPKRMDDQPGTTYYPPRQFNRADVSKDPRTGAIQMSFVGVLSGPLETAAPRSMAGLPSHGLQQGR